MIKTSISHPIRVDWLRTPWPGKVGLTFAPGKKQRSADSGGIWDRDLSADLERLRADFATDHLVCLLEDHEMESLGIPDLLRAAEQTGMSVHRLPIQDGHLPDDDTACARIVADIAAWANSGENVVVHCRGGLGRAGTIGGCVLIAGGFSPDEALQALREARGPGCPETPGQRRYITRFRR